MNDTGSRSSLTVELLRRLVALALIMAGVYLFFSPGGMVLVVGEAGFQRFYKKHLKLKKALAPSYEEFIAKRTKGRKLEVNGDEWQRLAGHIKKPQGKAEIMSRRCGYTMKSFAYWPDEPPFAGHGFFLTPIYISIDGGAHWLSVRADYTQEVANLPGRFAHPFRYYGLVLFVLGFAVYFAIPRKKPLPGDIHYPGGKTVFAPDLLGLGLTPFFWFLPFLVVWENGPGLSVLNISHGWIWLTCAFWLMAAVSLMFLRIGLNYCALAYRIEDKGLAEIKGRDMRLMPWEEMAYFQSYEKRTSTRLAKLLILFGGLQGSLQALGLGVAMDGNNEVGIYVYDKKGAHLKIMENALKEFDSIVAALKEHGIKRKRKVTK